MGEVTVQGGIALLPIDFSKRAVDKAVLRNSWETPLVTLPSAVGIVGLVSSAVLGTPVVIGLGLLFGVLMFGVNYFMRRDTLATQYLQEFNDATREQSKAMAEYLNKEFAELDFTRGIEQIKQLLTHLAIIKTLLAERFTKGDVSYEQFLGPAETLVSETLNLLKDAGSQLQANKTFDPTDGAAQTSGNGNAVRRRELFDEGTKHFDELIEKADSAITGLAELTHDVAHIGSGASTHDDFIQRVREVSSRAGLYVDEKRI